MQNPLSFVSIVSVLQIIIINIIICLDTISPNEIKKRAYHVLLFVSGNSNWRFEFCPVYEDVFIASLHRVS